jgi:hypothetical protein
LAHSGAENQGLGIVKGSAPSKTEEKPDNSISVRRAGYVEHRLLQELCPTVGKRKNKEEPLCIMVRTWTNWKPRRESLGTSGDSGWKIVAARGGTEPQKNATSRNTRKRRSGDTPLGYSGRTAVRRER